MREVEGSFDREKMVCPCCGIVFPSDKGGIRYCIACVRVCDGEGCRRGEPVLSGRNYLLREGQGKPVALYTRCEDPLFCRAELLVLVINAAKRWPGVPLVGVYDIDLTYGVEEILKSHQRTIWQLLKALRDLRSSGWKFKAWKKK